MIYLRIPVSRLGVLIGKNGEIHNTIEKNTNTKIEIDSEDGEITIDDSNTDAISATQCKNVVLAIGRGFAPKQAFRLFNEDMYLEIVNLKEFYGKKIGKITNARSRIIGTAGKTRSTLEEMTGAYICIYGYTVSTIGTYEEIELVKRSIEMFLQGSKHSTVYKFLEDKRREERYKIDYY